MNTKKLLNSLYRKIESTLTDKELLVGRAYKEYCSKVADGMTSKYGNNTNVTIVADESDGAYSAYTDGKSITVNAFCKAYNDIKNLTERHWCVLGRIVHECGHILWTNFKLDQECQRHIKEQHLLYPATTGDQTELKELLDKEPSITGAIVSLWHNLMNCVEDGFIEKLLLIEFPGYGQYLASNREMSRKGAPSYKDMKGNKINALIGLALQQAKFGDVPEFEADDLGDDVVQTFISICPIIDSAVDERSSYHRQQKVNDLFLGIIHIIIEEIKKQQQEQQQQSSGSGESSPSNGSSSGENSSGGGSSNEGSSNEEPSSNEGSSNESSSSEGSSGEGSSNGNSSNEGSSGEGSPNGNSSNGSSSSEGSSNENSSNGSSSSGSSGGGSNGGSFPTEELKKALTNASEKAEEAADDGSKHNMGGETPLDDAKQSSSVGEPQQQSTNQPANESNTLDSIKKQEVENQVEKQVENGIQNELKKNAEEMKKVNAIHKNVPFRVIRAQADNGECLYQKEHEYLDTLSRRMMKNLQKEIKDRALGDALDGNYFGNRLDTANLYRRDKKLYIKDILPENVPDMEISIVIDCSGSMDGENIDQARKTAYTVWKFCSSLKIPVSVIGHDTDGGSVRIYSVADSASIDGQDGRRIFSLRAGGCNRDGFALRFAIKKLENSQAQDKILFVISDGRPNHRIDGYDAATGSADIKDAVAKAKKNGLTVITAGIGHDAPNINRIWTEGVSKKRAAAFLEIGDLEKLPKSFIKVIKAQLELEA